MSYVKLTKLLLTKPWNIFNKTIFKSRLFSKKRWFL